MAQIVITIIIITFAMAWVIVGIVRTVRNKKGCSCGCGCSGCHAKQNGKAHECRCHRQPEIDTDN